MIWILRHFFSFLRLCWHGLRRGRADALNDYYSALQREEFKNDRV